MDAAVWDQTIAPLRSRAGVTSVIPPRPIPTWRLISSIR
ncbi:MAG: hypothetical protein ACLR3T_01780 [Alistipes finegoldii]